MKGNNLEASPALWIVHLCTMCGKRTPEFAELSACVDCLGAQILKPEVASATITTKIQEQEAKARRALKESQPRFWVAIVSLLEGRTLRPDGNGIRIDFSGWELLDSLREFYGDEGPDREEELLRQPRFFYEALHDLARLRHLQFDLQQGVRVLLDGVPADLLGPDRLAPPYAVTPRTLQWKSVPYLAFGIVPVSIIRQFPTFADALLREDPRASISRVTKELGLDIRLTHMLVHTQLFNYNAPRMRQFVDTLSGSDAAILQRCLLALANLAEEPSRRTVEGAGAAWSSTQEVSRLFEEAGNGGLVPLLTAGNESVQAPLFVPSNGRLLYSPELLSGFAVLCRMKLEFPDKQKMSDLASEEFVEFVRRLLVRQGFETTASGLPLVNLKTRGSKENEIDVLGWNPKRVLMLEIKGEAQHPGDSSSERWTRRARQVEEWQAHLVAKSAAWERLLKGEDRKVSANGTEVEIPPGLLSTRVATSAVVSMRVEPKTELATPPVRTYMPPLALPVALEVFPENQVSAFWDGETPISD